MTTTTTTITAPTDEQLEAAEREFAEASQKLVSARARYAQVYLLQNNGAAAAAVADARGRYDVAHATLNTLREAREYAQQVEVRRGLEKKLTKELTRRAEELAASRDVMVSALAEAQQALVAAIAATQDHNAVLGEHAGELAAAGFSGISDDYQTGSDTRGRVVVLSGQYWREVDPSVMLAQLVERTRLARLEPGNFEIRVRRFEWGHMTQATAAKVLGLVPLPKIADSAPPRMPAWGRRPVEDAR